MIPGESSAVAFVRPSPREEADDGSRQRRDFRKAVAVLSFVVALEVVGNLTQRESTTASFSDTSTMTETVGASAPPPAPTDIYCESGMLVPAVYGAIISWSAVPEQNGHKVQIDFSAYRDVNPTNEYFNRHFPSNPILRPGTNKREKLRPPHIDNGHHWVRMRSVYVDPTGISPTWYSTDERVFHLYRRGGGLRTMCQEKVS